MVRCDLGVHPALASLTPETLVQRFGSTEVWVSGSDKEQRDVAWLKTTLRDYLQPATHLPVNSARFYLSENESLLERWGLLDLLRDYVKPLIPLSVSLCERSAVWLGHRGTRTGLHADPDGFNLLCQLWGTKRVWLLDAMAARSIVRSRRFDGGAMTTDTDFWTTSHPELAIARRHFVVLERGDVLYVPRWWWHAAENMETSLALSYRAESLLSFGLSIPVEVRHLLHSAGLYRKGDCTCHPPEEIG